MTSVLSNTTLRRLVICHVTHIWCCVLQGARENLPGPALDGKEGQRVLQPRSMADRAAHAAALQPISASRAELLGVQVGCLKGGHVSATHAS